MKPKKPRRMPNKTERLAAALLAIRRGDSWLIPEPLRSSGDAKAICAHVTPDHTVPWTWTHDNSPQNIVFHNKEDHLEKTTKRDIPAIAKVNRALKRRELTPEEQEARRALLKIEGREEHPKKKPKRKWGSRPMAGSRDSEYKVRMTKHGRKVERRRDNDR